VWAVALASAFALAAGVGGGYLTPGTDEAFAAEPAAGTTITVTSGQWTCSGPLSGFGPLPIKVVHDAPNGAYNAIRLDGTCSGDGDPSTIDLILDVRGNGGNRGPGIDAVKLDSVGVHDIEITGRIECGAVAGAAHQDGVQVQRGKRVTFIGLRSGNVVSGARTCFGAGGMFFISSLSGLAGVEDVVCRGCVLVGENQGIGVNTSTRSGATGSIFRTFRASPCRVVGGVGQVPDAQPPSVPSGQSRLWGDNVCARTSVPDLGDPPVTDPPVTTGPAPAVCDTPCRIAYETRIAGLEQQLAASEASLAATQAAAAAEQARLNGIIGRAAGVLAER
jgi:hypothetical protein